MIKRIILGCIAVLSLLLLYFAVKNYRDSRPIADETLFGLAHSLHAAIEFSAVNDPTLRSLARFHSHDVAYFALVDTDGVYRYHTNPELVGTRLSDKNIIQRLLAETMTGERVRLDSGEEAYELFSHVHTHDAVLGLRLVLHTYRADMVIHNARVNTLIMVSLLLLSWSMIAVVFRYSLKEEKHKLELAKHDNLARMGEMGAILAHEIRNPLAGIKGFAQLIEKKTNEPQTRDSAHRISTETLRLENLTTNLLAFARSDEFVKDSVNLSELIENTLSLAKPEAERSNISFERSGQSLFHVYGNADRLAQVLLNIVTNAVQAMPDGGTLCVSTRRVGNEVVIEIRDSGHGIAAGNLAKIFDPFFTTRAKGTGLGLALCKKIVSDHGGSIHIASSDSGTTVTMLLPESSAGETA